MHQLSSYSVVTDIDCPIEPRKASSIEFDLNGSIYWYMETKRFFIKLWINLEVMLAGRHRKPSDLYGSPIDNPVVAKSPIINRKYNILPRKGRRSNENYNVSSASSQLRLRSFGLRHNGNP